MKNMIRIAALGAALTLAAPAAAQQAQHTTTQGKVGLGLGLPTDSLGAVFNLVSTGTFVSAPLIFVPMNVSPNLRVEPHLGYFKVSDDAADTTSSAFSIGVGVFLLKPMAAQTQLYAGARLGFTFVRSEDGGGAFVTKTTQRNTTLAPTLGMEYLPSPSFAVGAEAQLAYTALGDRKISEPGTPTVTIDGGSTFATQGLFFIRIFFM